MTKERLRRYTIIKQEVEQLRQRLVEVEEVQSDPKIPRLALVPTGPVNSSPQENRMIHRIELQEMYRAKLDELASEQLAIEQAIEQLDPTARMLLRYRYIDGLQWEQVCVKMSYSWRQTHYLHGEALRQLSLEAEKDTPVKEVMVCTSKKPLMGLDTPIL